MLEPSLLLRRIKFDICTLNKRPLQAEAAHDRGGMGSPWFNSDMPSRMDSHRQDCRDN